MTAAPSPSSSPAGLRTARNVVLKALALYLIFNLLFAAGNPLPVLGRFSAYNRLFPGRLRLPYADDPARAYSLSLFNLEAMFASHAIAASPKPADEFRVVLIGDSSTWGYLLENQDTLAGQLNAAGLALPDGRRVRAYNLGYPVMSLTKDLLILSYAMRYEPDLVVWPVTLESFPRDKQFFPPLLQQNPEPVARLIAAYDLSFDPPALAPGEVAAGISSPWDRTLIAQRRNLADLLRLQLYGPLWAATGIDQDIPATYTPRQEDLPADPNFHELQPPHLSEADLAFAVLAAGVEMAGETPVLIVNEPTFVSQGQNSDVRYNFYYPRWAYDDYRTLLAGLAAVEGWHYRDLWRAAEDSEFTNTAVHLSPRGSAQFANKVGQAILEVASRP